MVWYNHKLVTLTAVYAVTGGALSAITAASASLLPDVFELGGVFKHRGASHWPYPYLVVASILYEISCMTTSLWPFFAFYLLVGASLHLVEDSLSKSGIPWKSPFGPTKGASLYYTGTGSEHILVLVLIIIFLLISHFRDFFTKNHFDNEVRVSLTILRVIFNF
jgi:membrane-bound metal-dependent hydrolase YbcI (DUF457 family)